MSSLKSLFAPDEEIDLEHDDLDEEEEDNYSWNDKWELMQDKAERDRKIDKSIKKPKANQEY